jgi:hypothetical protein
MRGEAIVALTTRRGEPDEDTAASLRNGCAADDGVRTPKIEGQTESSGPQD